MQSYEQGWYIDFSFCKQFWSITASGIVAKNDYRTGGADFSTQESNKMILSLQNFSDISVRESASKIALGQRLKEKYIEVVLDPVFLTSKNNWMQLAAKPVKKDYILFFKMGYSKTAEPALKFAKKLSEETGYELLMLWDQETWFKYRDVKHIGAVHMKIRKPVIVGSVLIGGMLIGTYYCGNKIIQFVALCITAIYAVLTNVDMLKSGVNLVKSRLGK